ncbi:MAG: hypothetical protein KJO07_17850, partial [Deltaproteobacteria bacterium]|nr:hypothetical protein [Deltaproteobacteria bacterium]
MIRFACTIALAAALALPAGAGAVQTGAGATKELLATLAKGPDAGAAKKVTAELAKLGNLEELEAFLKREHQSNDAERRGVLRDVGAAVPDKKGKFRTPKRKSAEQNKKDDDFDWLVALTKLPQSTARDESIANVAVVRALAGSRKPQAAAIILDFAFTELGLVYRDECGRYLRKMAPYSLPALIHASQLGRKNPSKDRYATYQLERMDRQNPKKAVDAASAELKVHILKAFADSGYREAVYATLDHTDHLNPKVRKAARDAWMEYIAGKKPRPAPKRKLQMPGGKLSDKREPLWLNHRELADIELRRRIEALTGKAPAANANLKAMTAELFGYFDARQNEKLDALFKRGVDLAGKNESVEAAELFDKVLAQRPDFDRRALMAPTYFNLGKKLRKQKKWREASLAFAKAHSV